MKSAFDYSMHYAMPARHLVPLEVEGEREGEETGGETAEGNEEEGVEAERQDRCQHHHVRRTGELHGHQPQRDRRVLPPPWHWRGRVGVRRR